MVRRQALTVPLGLPGACRSVDRVRVLQRREHALGERPAGEHRVAHALAGHGVLEVAGVADQRPTGARGGPEEGRRISCAAQLAAGRRPRQPTRHTGVLAELAPPVALGIAARFARLVPVAHEQHQHPARRGARKRERERVALPPLVVGLRLDLAGQRVLEVAEDQASAVPGEPVGRPRADQRRGRRPAPVRPDHEPAGDLAHAPAALGVAHSDHPAPAPQQRLHGAMLAHLHALLPDGFDELDVLQVPWHADAVVDAVRSRAQPLERMSTLGLYVCPAHQRGVERKDPRQRAELAELARARRQQHMGRELIGGKAHPVKCENSSTGPGQGSRRGASRQTRSHDHDVHPLHLLPSSAPDRVRLRRPP